MERSEIIGTWSFDVAYKDDLSSDKQLHFYENGSGCVTGGSEAVLSYEWEISEDREDILIGNNSLPDGELCGKRELMPSGATLSTDTKPMGKFKILKFSKFSLPFGLREFAKIKT